MANFILSAFADEAAGSLEEQIEVLEQEGIHMIELRGVGGISCADLSVEQARAIKQKLDEHHITLSALGSPYGKIGICDDFEEHLEKFKKTLEICNILDCKRIRMFSFYYPEQEGAGQYREEVLSRLEQMVKLAEEAGVLLAHENEKGIYGDIDSRCMDLYQHFGGRLGVIFDPANYIQCGVQPLEAYALQKETITYFHMKDALMEDGSVVSVGNGDGHVPEILADVNRRIQGEVILTIEPHLHVFDGLSKLQDEQLKHKESYRTSREAFHAACEAVKNCIQKLEEN